MIRIAFWGTPDLTTAYLDTLETMGLKPVVVVTNPDRPKGRGQELAAPAAKTWGLAHNVPVRQPEKLDDAFYAELASFNLDLSVVVAFGSILPQRFIDLPKHGTLNVHYSLLPRFRGASPIEASILSGDGETGCAIQVMAKSLDSGPLIAERKTPIDPDETAPELRHKLTDIGARLLAESIPEYVAGSLVPVPQDETRASTCGKIQKEDGYLNLAADALQNYRKYRAYYEWPRTYFFTEQKSTPDKKLRVIITKAHMEAGVFSIDRVLPEGRREMAYADFLRGQK